MKKKLLVPVIMMLLPLCNSLFMSKANAQTTDNKKQKDAIEIGIDSIWRSSDFEGETPVLRQQRKAKRVDGSASLPEGSERVGCICMDYFVLDRIGRGACTGHNGVRFWLYQLPSGDTVQIPTLRHEGHPDTLDNSTLLQLAAYKRYERVMAQRQIDFYTALEEHPEWLNGFLDNMPHEAAGGDASAFRQRDTLLMPMPFSPVDHSAENTLLYSISVLLGSGALFVIKKITESMSNKDKDESPVKEPDNLI
jgi:hypothetical protein